MPILFCVCHSRYSNRPLGDGVWLLKTSQRRWCMAVEDEPTWLTSSGSAVCELQRQISVRLCYFLKGAPLHQHPAHARLGVCAGQGYCFMFRLPNCGNLWLWHAPSPTCCHILCAPSSVNALGMMCRSGLRHLARSLRPGQGSKREPRLARAWQRRRSASLLL